MIILPAIDIHNGNCVRLLKGDFNTSHIVAESYIDTAKKFEKAGAEWIHMVDLDGAKSGKPVNTDIFIDVAKNTSLKVEVGGGIRNLESVEYYINNGISRVILGSIALKKHEFVKQCVDKFGEKIAVGIDAKKVGDKKWTVYINGGRVDMKLDLIEWVHTIEKLGAGEICLNSIDADGTKNGFDIDMLDAVCKAVNIPVIASGGAGKIEDFSEVFEKTGATAALAASLFHFNELTVGEVKKYCKDKGIIVR